MPQGGSVEVLEGSSIRFGASTRTYVYTRASGSAAKREGERVSSPPFPSTHPPASPWPSDCAHPLLCIPLRKADFRP